MVWFLRLQPMPGGLLAARRCTTGLPDEHSESPCGKAALVYDP
jgi:hypothetical protein